MAGNYPAAPAASPGKGLYIYTKNNPPCFDKQPDADEPDNDDDGETNGTNTAILKMVMIILIKMKKRIRLFAFSKTALFCFKNHET
jgi:hypothetical protein